MTDVNLEVTTAEPEAVTPEATTTPTPEEIAAELQRTRDALKKANAEAAKHRKAAEAATAAEEARKTAEMTELERFKAQAEAEAKRREEAEARLNRERITNAVKFAAAALNFHDPADALAHLDAAALEIGEDGSVTGVKEALDALAKAKPYLVKSERGAGVPQSPQPSNGATLTHEEAEAYQRDLRRKVFGR